MRKPTTIQIPDFVATAIRLAINFARQDVEHKVSYLDAKLPKMFQMYGQREDCLFPMTAISVGKPIPTPHRFQVFHTEFKPFGFNEKDPQISCHMIGHVHWDDGERELVSIRWRFNLDSENQTNAYVTYL
jgi:hypothetical protein